MRNFCLHTSKELILIPNCSLLYLHSNDTNSLESLVLEILAINIILVINIIQNSTSEVQAQKVNILN